MCPFKHPHQPAEQVPTPVAQKKLICTREKVRLWQLCSFFQLEKDLLCQDSFSASRAFLIGYYKNKNTKNLELGRKPSKDNTVLWGSHYPKIHTQPGTLCSFILISSRCTAQETTLIHQVALIVWASVLAIVAGHWRAKLPPILPLNGNIPWLDTLRVERTSRN